MIPPVPVADPHPLLAGVNFLNPLDWVSVLRFPIGGVIYLLSHAFNAVGFLQVIGPFGLAIVVTTLIIRGLLFPIFRWSIRKQRQVQREQRLVAPQLNEVRKRYRGNNQKIYQETQRIYAEHGISMYSQLGGCLPVLVQLPVLYGLYWGIRDVIGSGTTWGGIKVTFDLLRGVPLHFLWIPDVSRTVGEQIQGCAINAKVCAVNWGHLFSPPGNLALLIFPVLTGLAYFIQSKITMPPIRADMSEQERQMASSMRMVVYFMPLMSVFFGFIWPQGLTLYWLTASLVMIGQQFQLMGWGSMKVPPWFPGARRVTPLSFQTADLGAIKAPALTSNGSGQDGRAPGPAGRAPVRTATTRRSTSRPAPRPPTTPGMGRAPARPQRKARRRR
ncbi:MAG TPA: YidC/Oxa1 family membrane protein insertase [Candidatus Binatia bacterium]|nr:YidC/Oxa1 family membrane protein insertase [Candidatus Binatia bacterium]